MAQAAMCATCRRLCRPGGRRWACPHTVLGGATARDRAKASCVEVDACVAGVWWVCRAVAMRRGKALCPPARVRPTPPPPAVVRKPGMAAAPLGRRYLGRGGMDSMTPLSPPAEVSRTELDKPSPASPSGSRGKGVARGPAGKVLLLARLSAVVRPPLLASGCVGARKLSSYCSCARREPGGCSGRCTSSNSPEREAGPPTKKGVAAWASHPLLPPRVWPPATLDEPPDRASSWADPPAAVNATVAARPRFNP